mmetsp:Transcript_728/g.1682  ORF Transcript_728/g.1682 Transcript_728/m.1682 type:complete len:221 (-) Transcript_728:2032-2694(-)
MVESGTPYSCEIVRRTRSIRRMNCKIVPAETVSSSLKVKDASSGKVSRLISASEANVGKMLRLHASQHVPPSQRRPSINGRSLCAASSKMEFIAILLAPDVSGCMHVTFVLCCSRVSRWRRSASKMWWSIVGTSPESGLSNASARSTSFTTAQKALSVISSSISRPASSREETFAASTFNTERPSCSSSWGWLILTPSTFLSSSTSGFATAYVVGNPIIG